MRPLYVKKSRHSCLISTPPTPLPFPLQAAGPAGAPASYTARTDSVCAVCRIKAFHLPVVARLTMASASFMAGCISSAMLGSCRYVGMLTRCSTHLTKAGAQNRQRAEERERYGIRGSRCGDRFASRCCQACALTQERREIELEENSLS